MLNVFLLFLNSFLRFLFFLAWLIPQLLQKNRKMTKGSTFWAIWVPKWLNPSGKSAYMYFHTKAEAERKRGELLAATRTESKVDVLSPAQIRDAVRALERLAEAGLDVFSG